MNRFMNCFKIGSVKNSSDDNDDSSISDEIIWNNIQTKKY